MHRSADGQPVFEVNTPRLWAAVNGDAPAAGPTVAVPALAAAAQQSKQRPPAAKAPPRITGAKRAAAAPASPRGAGSAATPPPAAPAAPPAAAAAEAGPAGWSVIIVKALSASDVSPVRPATVLPSPAVQAAFPGAAAGGLPASIPVAGGGAALVLSASESGGKIRYMLGGTREYLAAAGAQKGDAAGILRGPAGALLFEVGTPRMQAALLRAAAAAGPSPGGKRRNSGSKKREA